MRIQEKIAFTKPECSNKKQNRCFYLVSLLLAYINLFLWGKFFLPEIRSSTKLELVKSLALVYTSVTLRHASAYRRVAYVTPIMLQAIVSRIGKKEIPKGELSKESYDFFKVFLFPKFRTRTKTCLLTPHTPARVFIYFSQFVLYLHVQMKLHLEYVLRHILKENIQWKTVISVQMPRNLTTLSGINDCWLMTKQYKPNHMYFENIPSSHIYKHLH